MGASSDVAPPPTQPGAEAQQGGMSRRSAFAVKICGLCDSVSVATAAAGGATHIGFVFYPKSPRFLEPVAAGRLVHDMPPGPLRVGVVVDPDDRWLDEILDAVPLDLLQVHGNEPPERVAAIRARSGLKLMKAIRVAGARDLDAVTAQAEVADWLLFDAKPPRHEGSLPGGNGLAFDWMLLKGLDLDRPWLLSGGLDAHNLAAALAVLEPDGVDVSSGVERAPGVKDPARITEFLLAAARLSPSASPEHDAAAPVSRLWSGP